MATRSDRNNNPGNIKYSKYTKDYPGVIGVEQKPAQDGGHFLIFDSPQSGLNAMKKLIVGGSSYQGVTAEQAIKKWNGGGSYGAADVGLNPNQDIQMQLKDPSKLNSVVQAMAKAEGFTGGGGGQLSYKDFAAKIKAKYPQYAGQDDLTLTKAIIAKYPEYASKVSLSDNPTNASGFDTTPSAAIKGKSNGVDLNAADQLATKANGLVGATTAFANDKLKNFDPTMALNTAWNFPGELVHQSGEAIKNFADPELKGIATGARTLQSTPDVAKGLFHALIGQKQKANQELANANKTMSKPLLGQKTAAGSSNTENVMTAANAAIQAATAKAPEEALSGATKAAKFAGKGLLAGAKTAGKVGLGVLTGGVGGLISHLLGL